VWLALGVSLSPAAAAPNVSPAAAIAAQLNSNLVNVTDYTAATDPEQLLGVPGEYTAKAAFADARGVVGTVEVFATPDDFANRLFTIKALQVSPSVETDLPDTGDPTARVLVRLWIPPELPPDALRTYQANFATALASTGYPTTTR